MSCNFWAKGKECGRKKTRRYLVGDRCDHHTPARVAGRPEAAPDPARSIPGLKAAYDAILEQQRIDREVFLGAELVQKLKARR